MTTYMVTFQNKNGDRVSLPFETTYHILESDIPKLENWVDCDQDHGNYGPWKYLGSVRIE